MSRFSLWFYALWQFVRGRWFLLANAAALLSGFKYTHRLVDNGIVRAVVLADSEWALVQVVHCCDWHDRSTEVVN